jgi:hypothetical protein
MSFLFYACVFCLFLWIFWGRFYARGMLNYVLDNNLIFSHDGTISEDEDMSSDAKSNKKSEFKHQTKTKTQTQPQPQPHECSWDCVRNELEELKEAWGILQHQHISNSYGAYLKSTFDVFLEASDVLHGFLKYLVLEKILNSNNKIFSKEKDLYFYTFIIYTTCIFLFFLAWPTTLKLATRYKNHKCIRNHKNKNNLGHICEFKQD